MRDASVVPRILHRVRLGTDVLPPEATYYELLWKQLHPGWEHVTWTMTNLPPLVNRDLFYASENTGHRADVLRLEVLHRYGGVYTDIDVLPQKPLDPLLDCPGFLGQIRPTPRKKCVQRIETAVMGSAPGNALLGRLIEEMPRWAEAHGDWYAPVRTGPQFVQGQIDLWTGELPMVLYPQSYFYPYLWDELDRWIQPHPDAYAIHRWWGTWRNQQDQMRWPTPPPAPGQGGLR